MNAFKMNWRVSGTCGLLFVVLSFVASGINELPPAYNHDAAGIADWFVTNSRLYRGGHFMAGIAFLLFYFPFYAGLCERLRMAEGTPAIWTRVTWAGAILSPAVGTIAGAFINGLALLGENVTAQTSAFAIAANYYAYSVSGAFGGLAMAGAGMVILLTGVFHKWLGISGLVVGLSAIISTGFLLEGNPSGFFSMLNGLAWLFYFLWIATLSVVLIKTSKEAESLKSNPAQIRNERLNLPLNKK